MIKELLKYCCNFCLRVLNIIMKNLYNDLLYFKYYI